VTADTTDNDLSVHARKLEQAHFVRQSASRPSSRTGYRITERTVGAAAILLRRR
jgi:hypothetical protein